MSGRIMRRMYNQSIDKVQTCEGFASTTAVTVQAMTNGATRTHKLTPWFSVKVWRGCVQGKRVKVTLHETSCCTLHGETYSRISCHPMDVHAPESHSQEKIKDALSTDLWWPLQSLVQWPTTHAHTEKTTLPPKRSSLNTGVCREVRRHQQNRCERESSRYAAGEDLSSASLLELMLLMLTLWV